MKDYYQILEIARDSDFRAIKQAYYRQAKRFHPDLHGGGNEMNDRFKSVVEAFDVLSDPAKRSSYDSGLGQEHLSAALMELSAVWPPSIMDSQADDDLEELITGNSIPLDSRLSRLMLDLARTECFITFREGKNLFYQKRFRAARTLFAKSVSMSPDNILVHCFLARSCAATGDFSRARREYLKTIELGSRRSPPQELRRVRHELDTLKKMHSPWWYRLFAMFSSSEPPALNDASRNMIEETNRGIAGIERRRQARIQQDKRRLLDK